MRCAEPLELRGTQESILERVPAGEWRTLVSPSAAADLPPRSVVVVNDTVMVSPTNNAAVEVALLRDGEWDDPQEYPGDLRLVSADGEWLSVINHVELERYVACVTALESWPTFVTEALRGQAIVARSFALNQMTRRGSQSWDVGSSQGSQVYRGVQRTEIGRRAAAATQYTAGLVCAWNDGTAERIIPTYYSAACGGLSQSAAIFGPADDIVPLSGGVECDYCRMAPGDSYRWGPITLPLGVVWQRLAGRFPIMHQVWPLVNVEVAQRASTGHALRMRLTSAGGATHELSGENFRLALGGSTIKSVRFDVHVSDGQVIFANGQGYGHALGLCQWGMQGQALAGKSAGDILRHYYRGVRIVRAY